MLELGCGGGQWSIALEADRRPAGRASTCRASSCATPAALRRRCRCSSPTPNTCRSRDDAFDIVFCDHGALNFCDPAHTLPEVARVLRPGGLLAFCAATPLLYLTWNMEKGTQSRRLHHTYDDLGLIDFDDGTVDWVLPAGRMDPRAARQRLRRRRPHRAAAGRGRTDHLHVRAGQVGAPLARGMDLAGAGSASGRQAG